MAQYELRLYQRNGCGGALLGDVVIFDACDEEAAVAEAHRRIRELPRHCSGALFDLEGLQIWAPDVSGRGEARAES